MQQQKQGQTTFFSIYPLEGEGESETSGTLDSGKKRGLSLISVFVC